MAEHPLIGPLQHVPMAFAVLRRELLGLWVTPLAWALGFVFLTLQGVSFTLMVDHYNKFSDPSLDAGPIQGYFTSLFVPVSLLLVCPALSMRQFAEERRSGTIEMLVTAPVTAWSLVLGKYGATLVTYLLLWAPTVLYVLILRHSGTVDWRVVGSSYLGVVLLGASYLAVGTLTSALVKSQLVAMLLCTLLLFGSFILGIGERVFDPGPLLDVCRHVSALSQLEDFAHGIIDLRRLCYDLSVTFFALFLTARVVDSWRFE
jgi:ABC-2 type transport system permease protein